MSELKPCPFCGGEAEIVRHLSGWYPVAKHRGWCPMLRVDPPDDEYYITKSYAAESWNRRAYRPCCPKPCNEQCWCAGERTYYEADLRRSVSDMMDRRANDAE